MTVQSRGGRPKAPPNQGQVEYLAELMEAAELTSSRAVVNGLKDYGVHVGRKSVDNWRQGYGIHPAHRIGLAGVFGLGVADFDAELARRRAAVSVPNFSANLDVRGRGNGRLAAHSPGGGEPTGGHGGTAGASIAGTGAPARRNRFVDLGPLVELPVSARANAGEGGGFVATGQTVDVPLAAVQGRRNVRVVEIVGQCMSGVLDEGDYALIDADTVPDWEPGRPDDEDLICVTVLATDEVLLKYLVRRYEDGSIELRPRHEAPGIGQRRTLSEGDYKLEGVFYARFQVLGRKRIGTAAQGVSWTGDRQSGARRRAAG